MHIKRFTEAKPYEAPNHRGVVGLRLQGFEPGGPTNQWVGHSQVLPDGGIRRGHNVHLAEVPIVVRDARAR